MVPLGAPGALGCSTGALAVGWASHIGAPWAMGPSRRPVVAHGPWGPEESNTEITKSCSSALEKNNVAHLSSTVNCSAVKS